mmetsp:Transcript_13621/g.29587  ORF Transcript_13621/g.29587 Transcript_13621/m.29587 type:complete len:849 (-) Transcript_13621:54-2600(-)
MVVHEIMKTRFRDSEGSGDGRSSNPQPPESTAGRTAGLGTGMLIPGRNHRGNKKRKETGGNRECTLPIPKYLFCIYSPIVFTSEADTRTEETEQLYQSVWKSFDTQHSGGRSNRSGSSDGGERTHGAKIKIKMASLIRKMLDRLISESVIARERVLITTTQSQVFVRVLVCDKKVPTLIMRCERIGIGNVVGACWITPVDLAVVPSVERNTSGVALMLDDVSSRGSKKSTPHHHHSPSEEVDLAELGLSGEKDASAFARISMKTLEEEQSLHAKPHPLDASSASDDSVISIGGSEYSDIEDSNGIEDEGLEDLEAGSLRKRDIPKKLAKDVKDAKKAWVDIASRMRIQQVLQEVKVGASFSFDYLCYTIIAGWIAAFGLATDSSTVVIASMLVSPLMGPCMGMTFGAMVREWPLVWTSLRNECISLLLCVLIGFLVGLLFISEKFSQTYNEWPSDEMIGRGEPIGLIYGAIIAIPSGMAVALAQLGRNTGGLTGVAISLSLLPPAVNAGLCWCTALLVHSGANPRPVPPIATRPTYCLEGTFWCVSLQACVQSDCPVGNGTVPIWNTNGTVGGSGFYDPNAGRALSAWVETLPGDETNYALVGTTSFVLTIINIVCIFLGGCFMFWLKEVVPIRQKNTFWTRDVKAYREAKAKGPSASTTKSEIEAIDRGIRASIALNERMPQSFEMHQTENGVSRSDVYASAGAVDDFRGNLHRAYASNALESALFVGDVEASKQSTRNLRRRRPTRTERPLNQDLSAIEEEEDNSDDLANERGSLMRTAHCIPGGLAEAGSVLFSPSLEEEEGFNDNSSYRARRRPSFSHFRDVFSKQRLSRDNHDDVALHLSMTK